jgi:hypothetical protein
MFERRNVRKQYSSIPAVAVVSFIACRKGHLVFRRKQVRKIHLHQDHHTLFVSATRFSKRPVLASPGFEIE